MVSSKSANCQLSKSSIILFGKRNKSSLSVKLNNVESPVSSEIKLLGVMIDDQLTWKSHIQYYAGLFRLYLQCS